MSTQASTQAPSTQDIQALEKQIYELTGKLNELRKQAPRQAIKDYAFETLEGPVQLSDLFGRHDKLLAIHNMGQGCRYCTLWADGFNPFVPHLESALSVVLLSKDAPEVQRQFANSRHWRFRAASHGGGAYMTEQDVMGAASNSPGAVVYERENGTIYKISATPFGPGDLYCSMWNLLGLAGMGPGDWTPQYRYWQAPKKMDDGGDNVLSELQ